VKIRLGKGWYEDEKDQNHDDLEEIKSLASGLLEEKLEEVFSYKSIGARGGRYYG
jgi:hypothetical protein